MQTKQKEFDNLTRQQYDLLKAEVQAEKSTTKKAETESCALQSKLLEAIIQEKAKT